MNKSTLMDAFRNARGLSMVMGGALALLASGTTVAAEACGDGGGGSQDIASLDASYASVGVDGLPTITVEMKLCGDADNKTKYRLHFDHMPPYYSTADRNDDAVVDENDVCVTTSDTGMMHRGNRDTGPGVISVAGDTLTYTVKQADLDTGLIEGDTLYLWADTQDKGIQDRAPDTDASDGCAKPETDEEVIALDLSEAMLYEIGDTGPGGGIVFHVTDGGLHGLEAAPADQGSAPWGCFGTSIDGADGTAVDTGAQNTVDILAGCAERPIAASVADAYELNGVTDWFLPSRDELNLMYTNLHQAGLGGFAGGYYWSSSEASSADAWFQAFGSGFQGRGGRNATLRVRAVRAF